MSESDREREERMHCTVHRVCKMSTHILSAPRYFAATHITMHNAYYYVHTTTPYAYEIYTPRLYITTWAVTIISPRVGLESPGTAHTVGVISVCRKGEEEHVVSLLMEPSLVPRRGTANISTGSGTPSRPRRPRDIRTGGSRYCSSARRKSLISAKMGQATSSVEVVVGLEGLGTKGEKSLEISLSPRSQSNLRGFLSCVSGPSKRPITEAAAVLANHS